MAGGGTLPDNPKFREVSIKSVNPSIVTLASSGRKQVKTQNAQFWSFTATYPPMKRSEWAPIAAFIQQQRGSRWDFDIKIEPYSNTQGNLTTETVTVNGAHDAGDTSVALSSGSLTQTDSLKAGDFVSFAPYQTKVYMVTADVDFSSGSATMNIEPGLLVGVSSSDDLVYKNVEFTVFLNNDVQEWSTGLANIVEYELEVREAI